MCLVVNFNLKMWRSWLASPQEIPDDMRVLALITARGGSKRLPGKNIKLLGGRPLICWSIDVAKGIPGICDILVSTDDESIATVALEAGASVPWLRPVELATDEASSVDVCIHALNWYEGQHGQVDGLLLLQPTSPFRRRNTLLSGMACFVQHEHRSVVGVSPSKSHPYWCYKVEADSMWPFIEQQGKHLRSQDLPLAYVTNGAFYLISPHELRTEHSFFGANAVPFIMDAPQETLDIDTEWDWLIAEATLPLLQT